ncbi:hypothetical protein Fot_12426 [Forsythia ovata]|uniref:Uncharacterized protein n=1 Tax=Forsythia ovata TaxID=205694 RepID=A0ABD1WMV9_9LAMI
MAVTSPGVEGQEGFPKTCTVGTSIQLKYFIKEKAKNHYLNDQVTSPRCSSRVPDLMGALDAMEKSRSYPDEAVEDTIIGMLSLMHSQILRGSDRDAHAVLARL